MISYPHSQIYLNASVCSYGEIPLAAPLGRLYDNLTKHSLLVCFAQHLGNSVSQISG